MKTENALKILLLGSAIEQIAITDDGKSEMSQTNILKVLLFADMIKKIAEEDKANNEGNSPAEEPI